MKRILIIENEFQSIKAPIEVLLDIYQGGLTYDLCVKSQEIHWDIIESYNAILVDLSLAAKTEMDGYAILHKIKNDYPNIVDRCAIITGNGMVEASLAEKGISKNDFLVFTKPLKYMSLKKLIDKN